MCATLTISKMRDASLPLTRMIDPRFTVADGADIKSFKAVALRKCGAMARHRVIRSQAKL